MDRRMRLFSLYDRKAGDFGPIMWAPNDAVALRAVSELRRTDSPVGKYPEDFDVYAIGTFDQTSGMVVAESDVAPRLVMNVATYFGSLPGGDK